MVSDLDDSFVENIATLKLNPGASAAALAELRRYVRNLPAEYLSFLARSNGAEGPIGQANYLVLWPAEVIREYNKGYGADEFAPGLLLFGSDGGNSGYGFDCRVEPSLIFEVPLVGLDWSDAVAVAPDFRAFLQHLAR